MIKRKENGPNKPPKLQSPSKGRGVKLGRLILSEAYFVFPLYHCCVPRTCTLQVCSSGFHIIHACIIVSYRSMAKKTFQFLSPAAWIVMEIWQVNREKNSTLYYKKWSSQHTPSSKSSKFSKSGIYSSIDLNCFSSNANTTAITVILKIFPLDN